MAKRKNQNNHRLLFSLLRFPLASIPEGAQRLIWSVCLFSLALIFLLAFIEKAGAAGKFLLGGGEFLFGKMIFFAPLFFVTAGLVFAGTRRNGNSAVLFAFCLALIASSGVVAALDRTAHNPEMMSAGWIGFLVSWPFSMAFGFWVTELIFIALLAIAFIIFWQLLDHEQAKKPSAILEGAQEKMKKIFDAKFQVQEVEPEPKVQEGQETPQPELKIGEKFKLDTKRRSETDAQDLGDYRFPPLDLLESERGMPNAGDIKNYSAIIKKTLQNFDIPVEISEVNIGPTVTQYAFKPAEGIKLSRIVALQNDLSLALAAHPLRIEAPIPGRSLVGIEIPNKLRAVVRLRGLLENTRLHDSSNPLTFGLGRDVSGNIVIADIARMPHLLLAGATGTGKTIGLNNIILTLVFKNSPHRLRFVLVDPKRVEFPIYNELPHLLCPVIFDTQRTLNALKWLIGEMDRRFGVLSSAKARDIRTYHELLGIQKKRFEETPTLHTKEERLEEMPYVVVVIDELADLMAARGKEIEGMIVRLAQMARAVGIHLILATQRPSVEIITGLIKANITSRVAFQVASQVDSRTILDGAGAEKLLGQGDLLFISAEFSKPKRIQGAYVSDKEVKRVINWLGKENQVFDRKEIEENPLSQSVQKGLEGIEIESENDDPLYEEAKRVVLEARKASASLLQRRLKLGYARAARLLDTLEQRGVVGPADGAKPREVYIAEEQKNESEWVQP